MTTIYGDGFIADRIGRMPQTAAERQEARRKRLLIGEGKTEVRGIFLPPDLHAELKKLALKLQKRPAPKGGQIDHE